MDTLETKENSAPAHPDIPKREAFAQFSFALK